MPPSSLVPGFRAGIDLPLHRIVHLALLSLPHRLDTTSAALLQGRLVLFDVAVQHSVRGIDRLELLVVDDSSLLVLAAIVPALQQCQHRSNLIVLPTHNWITSAQQARRRKVTYTFHDGIARLIVEEVTSPHTHIRSTGVPKILVTDKASDVGLVGVASDRGAGAWISARAGSSFAGLAAVVADDAELLFLVSVCTYKDYTEASRVIFLPEDR